MYKRQSQGLLDGKDRQVPKETLEMMEKTALRDLRGLLGLLGL